ncbi:hypothetical protein [Bifidobacterium miconisargentati]|uniref:hypothetical protein n=1 Tax=Bifidobacterium miconisargentati TaxID=2834437 RepID=UPI001BDC294E|nr:hypothetical protein [Bifidobacterium miconisargentati]MBW3090108.1 hypothetical protein [Bifidobacterium miconisargentati]
MAARRYLIVRGTLLDDPRYMLAASGTESVRLRVGIRMPDGLVEPVRVEAGDVMPDYCRERRLTQGDLVVVSGWAREPEPSRSIMASHGVLPVDREILIQADMIAAGTSLDWRRGT